MATLWSATRGPAAEVPAVEYNRDVRQILSNHCYACHGPDQGKRQAGLRLDTQQTALAVLDSGNRAIVPGDSPQSKLIERIAASDDELVMPPPAAGKRLKPAEIEMLRRWIDEGARWQAHWSYLPVGCPPLPSVSDPAWAKTPIDRFILERLDAEGLIPSPEADRRTLIRRLSFDLTGLPPSIAEVEEFAHDTTASAYERVVDRLLASPRHGERMAQRWLDLARYADTNGYHIDNHRDMWRYRQWVIDAFNRNLPFDRFTTEQIAGDLLPGATLEQKIASGFHRNVMVNFEGGADPAEYLSKYIVDRVTTTATVFLGSTLACTECHDHKYDPFTQREFYQLYAYFNSVPEQGLDGQKENPRPSIRVPSPEQVAERETLRSRIAALEEKAASELANATASASAEMSSTSNLSAQPREYVWIDDALPAGGDDKEVKSWQWAESPAPVLNGSRSFERSGDGTQQLVFSQAHTPLVIAEGDKLIAHVYLDPANPPEEIMVQFHDGANWEHRAYWGASKIDWGGDNSASRRPQGPLPLAGRWARLEVAAAEVDLPPGSTVSGWACTQYGGHALWDRLALVTCGPQGDSLYDRQETWELVERSRAKSTAPAAVLAVLKLAPAECAPSATGRARRFRPSLAHRISRLVRADRLRNRKAGQGRARRWKRRSRPRW